jgi:hypothetical protein
MNGLNRASESRRHHPWIGQRGLRLAGALLLALPGALAFAGDGEVYTWKDAAGRVHYGNRLPEGQAGEPVQLNAKPVTVQPTQRIYTWTDAEGKIQYGARPPPDIPAKELREEDSSLSTIRSTQVREGERQLLREQR